MPDRGGLRLEAHPRTSVKRVPSSPQSTYAGRHSGGSPSKPSGEDLRRCRRPERTRGTLIEFVRRQGPLGVMYANIGSSSAELIPRWIFFPQGVLSSTLTGNLQNHQDWWRIFRKWPVRSEEHTSELQ